MNTDWKTFLLNQQALVSEENHFASVGAAKLSGNSIYPLTHLAVLSVTGKDAGKLLQGQITCNVNDISETKSSIAAICNPKGRAIATFFLVKKADAFLLVLPVELVETIKKRLQMVVLRSDVKIADSSDELFLIGLCETEKPTQPFVKETQQDLISVNLPSSTKRKLLIIGAENVINFWADKVNHQGFRVTSSTEWRYLDIVSGIPWLTSATSEEFIPQMLNLDKLGGISFNKGCYTGQEIVARTHYLGKAKREMLLAECQTSILPETNSSILNRDSNDQEVVGKILMAQHDEHNCKMLVILQIAEPTYNNLGLQEDRQAQVRLIPFADD
jgi:tRNA-modifying protein YgfZ